VTSPLVAGCDRPLVELFDAALLDLDGVVYVGGAVVPGAAEAVRGTQDAGARVAYVTNNASRTPEAVAEHLTALGIPASPSDVVTSAQAAATLVAALVPPGSAVLVVGGEGLRVALARRGLRPVASWSEEPAAVAQGFAPDVDWRLLAEGTAAVRAGVPWVASNLDLTIPTELGIAPGNGTLVQVIATASGRWPVVAGKPELPLHREAAERVGAVRPIVVGDRLDTDVEGAHRAGVASLLVLSGVTTPAELAGAPAQRRPTWLAEDVRSGLLERHDSVVRGAYGWQCAGWQARVDGRQIVLDGAGPRIAGVRALCVAAWETGRPAASAALAKVADADSSSP
jgi:HAD superfamily hydrolase (TIGR01450 family)